MRKLFINESNYRSTPKDILSDINKTEILLKKIISKINKGEYQQEHITSIRNDVSSIIDVLSIVDKNLDSIESKSTIQFTKDDIVEIKYTENNRKYVGLFVTKDKNYKIDRDADIIIDVTSLDGVAPSFASIVGDRSHSAYDSYELAYKKAVQLLKSRKLIK